MHAIEYVCLHLSEVCVHACCVLELLMACHVPREHTFTDTIIMIDIQGYVFPLIIMSL